MGGRYGRYLYACLCRIELVIACVSYVTCCMRYDCLMWNCERSTLDMIMLPCHVHAKGPTVD
jgi:hypothetical protein